MGDIANTPWERGRFDARKGPRKLLFGRMYEDAAIEARVFPAGGRVFCIASAGCTALHLAGDHEVVAVDINPVQLEYAAQRIAGAAPVPGSAERLLGLLRGLAPLAGWSRRRISEFLELDDPAVQLAYWRGHLDTRRFRLAIDSLFSLAALRAVYAAPLLDFLPPRLGAVMRSRLERCIARHPNRGNPYARALLQGECIAVPARPPARAIRLVQADAATFLEREPAGSFDGFALSNILDGAGAAYRERLMAALRHAAAPAATMVLRSFREPEPVMPSNRAAEDRSMLWGVVDARRVDSL